jgi:hypothetical protein
VLAVQLDVPSSKYGDSTRAVAFYDRLLGEAKSLPSVTSAGIITIAPLDAWHISGNFEIDGREATGPRATAS